MLYTRKGDDGTSGLYGTKERFSKDAPAYEALGTLDELNSLLGVCRATLDESDDETAEIVRTAQEHLFIAQAEIAGAEKTLAKKHLDWIEARIAAIEQNIQSPHAFVIPGATKVSAFFDLARTVARRAERAVIAARDQRPVSSEMRAYLNRLSSLLFALARAASTRAQAREPAPAYDH